MINIKMAIIDKNTYPDWFKSWCLRKKTELPKTAQAIVGITKNNIEMIPSVIINPKIVSISLTIAQKTKIGSHDISGTRNNPKKYCVLFNLPEKLIVHPFWVVSLL